MSLTDLINQYRDQMPALATDFAAALPEGVTMEKAISTMEEKAKSHLCQ